MADEPVEPWASAMRDRGIGDPRNGRPSVRALAIAAGVAPETVRRMLTGLGSASQASVQAVADALGKDVRTVNEWVGQTRSVRKPYSPPNEAHLLTDAERAAVDLMIRTIAKAREEGVPSGDTAPIPTAGKEPAASRHLRAVARRGDGKKNEGVASRDAQDQDAEKSQDPELS